MKPTCFIIVTFIVLKCKLDMTESYVCEPPSVYHNHTRTCVRLVQEKRAHSGARYFCANNFKGDLVFIYDSDTSSFIKEMLSTWNIQEALIGLQNAALYEQYRWGENQQNVTYFDWATPSYVEDKTKRAVVVTADGWRKYNYSLPADFICHYATVLPEVVLTCPVAKEGKQNHSLWCSVETYEDSQNPSIQFCRNNSKSLCPTHGYTTSNQTVGYNITAQLTISSVRRKDEGTWTCFIRFTVSSGTHAMNKSCNLMVYSIPQTPTCQHTSNDTHVLVTCSTHKVYPEAICLWNSTLYGIYQVLTESIQHTNYALDQYVYYNTSCTASFKPNDTGTYKIGVTMYAGYNQTNKGITRDHNIKIGPPDCPSQFDVKLIHKDSVIISWTPGHNGGLTQTFVFYSHTNTSLDRTMVATVVDDNKESLVYTVRNLEINTSLVFSVQVQNVISTTECQHVNVSEMVTDLENPETRRTVSDKILLYSIIPSCSVALIAVVTAVAVRNGCCRADNKERQNKTRSTLDTTSLNHPVDEDRYLIALTAIRGLPRTEHTYVQPVVGGDYEHESVSNVRVSVMNDSEHALEGSNNDNDNDNQYHVIQETDESMDQVRINEQSNPYTSHETDIVRTLGIVPGPTRLSAQKNVYDRLNENSCIDNIDVYKSPTL